MIKKFSFFKLLNAFITECETGKYLKSNGVRIRNGTISNYKNLKVLLSIFCKQKRIDLRIHNLSKCTQSEFINHKNYWQKIYFNLTNYLYFECNHFDNYVGSTMKKMRTFFNYLKMEKGIDTKSISKIFFVSKEEIPIIVLSLEQLNFLIYNSEFEGKLNNKLRQIKDIFVFGCSVGLRFSDLTSLTNINLDCGIKKWHIKLFSKKTGTFTRIKLADFAINILQKYQDKYLTLLPPVHLFHFNKYIRRIAEMAGWTQFYEKTRSKRGVLQVITKLPGNECFRFCDLITSHTMRRTAITLYLSLGIPEQLVRRISGHTPGSIEFYRYVKYAESTLDRQLGMAHSKLKLKNTK